MNGLEYWKSSAEQKTISQIAMVLNEYYIHSANEGDIGFLAEVDLLVDHEDGFRDKDSLSAQDREDHRNKISLYVRDADKVALVARTTDKDDPIGMVLCRFRNRWNENTEHSDQLVNQVFLELDDSLYPPGGEFCEMFQLWVDPKFRRQHIGTELKRSIEAVCKSRGVKMVYTHTREANSHVVDLNLKLGYKEVRRGAIWDDIIRVSLIKQL